MATTPTALTPEAARDRLVNDLYPPVREVVLAVDEIKAAWDARDLDRLDRAVRRADKRVAEYVEVMSR